MVKPGDIVVFASTILPTRVHGQIGSCNAIVQSVSDDGRRCSLRIGLSMTDLVLPPVAHQLRPRHDLDLTSLTPLADVPFSETIKDGHWTMVL